MSRDEKREERARVNPAARRDRAGEPHGEEPAPDDEAADPVKGYQTAESDPRDQGGIKE